MAEPAADEVFAHIRAFEWDERKREAICVATTSIFKTQGE